LQSPAPGRHRLAWPHPRQGGRDPRYWCAWIGRIVSRRASSLDAFRSYRLRRGYPARCPVGQPVH